MKDLGELTHLGEQDLPNIYCDMDQVLCNFLKGADKAVGGSFVTADRKTRWNTITSMGKKFWENLEWMPGSKQMYSFISKYDPYVLSAYSDKDATGSKTGKMNWLKKNTKFKRSKINLVLRDQKKKFAKDNDGKANILIDDYEKNIKEWEQAGGIGVIYTNAPNTIRELKKLGFK